MMLMIVVVINVAIAVIVVVFNHWSFLSVIIAMSTTWYLELYLV